MYISSMFEFAFGKEVNFGNDMNVIPIMKTLDFSKDVEGYGFSIRDGIDADLSKVNTIKANFDLNFNRLEGVMEFKTEKSGCVPEQTEKLYLSLLNVTYSVPKLSSPLKEIVFWFPKSLNDDPYEKNIIIYGVELIED